MNEKIIEILEGIHDGVDYASATDLIDSGLLDSFDVVSLIGELQEEFDIQITINDMVPENFNSVDAIAALIKRIEDDI
ncbi:MAG: acyl carrier protein [Clostridia bacterium]|nr:acyl carrier protein [Clostridia bacterium]